ncbi:hypothetical protein LIER_19650 [Lithospermum erythrorhizon]|uniref:Uncharacterized protein n=1 Tax=Lithospermum erythrorhizon TaxID=34254 RepID=A0AAV3QJL7_LITER
MAFDSLTTTRESRSWYSANEHEHTELIDIGESPECLMTEVVESCPLVLPTLSLAQEAESILRAGWFSLWSRIGTRLKEKSQMILKEKEGVMSTF